MATVADRPPRARRLPPAPEHPARRRNPRLIGTVYLLAPLFATLASLFAIAAAITAIALNLGSGPAPPATGAASLVPANALLYLNISTDSSRAAVQQTIAKARRIPGAPLVFGALTSRLDALLSGSSTNTVDFARDVRPWLGPEVAFAVLNTPGAAAGTLITLDVRNKARARAFLSAQGALPVGEYRKVRLMREPSGTTLAFIGHYLVLGQATSVTAAIDVASGRAPSLSASAAYGQATAEEPAGRVLDFYAPAAGIRRALVPSQGLLGALGTVLDQPAVRAVSVAVSPSANGFSVLVHSTLDPKLAAAASAQTPAFAPSLAAAFPAGSMLLLDVRDVRRAVPKLLAAAAKLGIAGRASALLGRLGAALVSEGVNLRRFFSIFGSESAFAIVPGFGGTAPAPVLVGRSDHPGAALNELSALEAPLTQAFTPPSSGGGVVPEVGAVTMGRATVSQLTLAPGFQLDWGVSHGLVVVSTSPGAVAAVISHRSPLSGERAYQAAVGGLPSQVTSLVFFDLDPLLRLGLRLGLIGGTTLGALRPELEQIRTIGLATTRGESDTTTQLQLQIR